MPAMAISTLLLHPVLCAGPHPRSGRSLWPAAVRRGRRPPVFASGEAQGQRRYYAKATRLAYPLLCLTLLARFAGAHVSLAGGSAQRGPEYGGRR